MERFGQVVHRARGQAPDLVEDVAACAEEDHGDPRRENVALDLEAHLVAAGVGQHHVEQDQVGQQLADEPQTVLAGRPMRDEHSVRLEPSLQDVGRRRVVLDDDDPRRGGVDLGGASHGRHHEAALLPTPSRCLMATTNFDWRRSGGLPSIHSSRRVAQSGISSNHLISKITSGSCANTGPRRAGTAESAFEAQGTARYMRLWSAVIRTRSCGPEYAMRLYCVATTGRAPRAMNFFPRVKSASPSSCGMSSPRSSAGTCFAGKPKRSLTLPLGVSSFSSIQVRAVARTRSGRMRWYSRKRSCRLSPRSASW